MTVMTTLPAIWNIADYGSVYWFLCFVSLSSYRYLVDGGTDRCEILHDRKHQTAFLPFLGAVAQGIPQIRNFGHLTVSILKTVKFQHYMSIRA